MFDRNLMKLDGMPAVMAALVLLALMQAAALIGQSWLLAHALSALWFGASVQETAPDIVGFIACFSVLHLIRFAQETMLDRFSKKKACNLRDSILNSTFDARTMLAKNEGAASVVTTATEGIDQVQTYVRIIPPKIVGMAALSIPLLIGIFAIDWVSGIILAIMFPVIIFFMVLLGRQASARAERQYAAYTRLSNRFMDTLRGLGVIKAFGASDLEAKSVFSFSEKLRRATIRTLSTATLSSAVLDLCTTFGVAAVAMMLAFRLMDGSMSLAPALTALVLAPEYFSPIRAFASDFHSSLDGRNALEAVLRMTGPLSDREPDLSAEQPREQLPEWSKTCTLELDDVTFEYDESSSVGPLSISASGFERIAIIGKSGAGKSTLADLIGGFRIPCDGSIKVNGVSSDLSDPSWKNQVRYIPQSPYVFNASLFDNIRFYAPNADTADVMRAVEAVGLAEFVDELPDGLNTIIGVGERGVSGGQAHRIALARLLVDPHARILIFDEPTAHLDIETERDLKPAMLAAMEGRLVFFATHRLHWVQDFERVITLDNGKVISDESIANPSDAQTDHKQISIASCIEGGSSENGKCTSISSPKQTQTVLSSDSDDSCPCPKAGTDDESVPARDAHALPEWFTRYLSRYKRSVVVALALGIAAFGCAALLMFTSGYLISATAQPGISLFSIMVPIAFVQIFGLGRPLARYLERLVSHDWVLKVTSDLRVALFCGIDERMGDPARERAAGEYLSILSDDIAHLQNLYLRVVFPTAIALLLCVGATILFGLFSLPFALVMLCIFGLTAVFMPAIALKATRSRAHRIKQYRMAHFARLADDVFGATDWILANRSDDAIASHVREDNVIRSDEAAVRLAQRSVTLFSSLMLGISACIVVIWAGNFFCTHDQANWIAAFGLGFFPIIDVIATLPAAVSQAPYHEDAIERLDQHTASSDAERVKPDAPSLSAPGNTNYGIELIGVTYSYPSASSQAVRDISIAIPSGQSLAILGRSGAGKSTIAQLVRGILKPDTGSVNAPSSDIGYLGQTPYLFNRTLRENLAIGHNDADDALLESALASVGLNQKLDSLEYGLDTVVGETGTGFSGGEAHRIALARVLVAGTPIVLVDEPFSALDPQTERELIDALFETRADKTLIVITHHLAEIERFDRVVFIEDGRIALDGSPSELKENSPYFQKLLAFDHSRVL